MVSGLTITNCPYNQLETRTVGRVSAVFGALKPEVATTFNPVKTEVMHFAAGIALMFRPADESGVRNAAIPCEPPLECSRCAAFVMMVQATHFSHFDNASIAWQLRSSWFWRVFGYR
jgi:hypothetical protein